jgi:hypothetical protein
VGPRAGLDTEARGKLISPLPGIEPQSPGRQARSHTLYRLSYPAHCPVTAYQLYCTVKVVLPLPQTFLEMVDPVKKRKRSILSAVSAYTERSVVKWGSPFGGVRGEVKRCLGQIILFILPYLFYLYRSELFDTII